jgi:hypothetical protein
MAKKRPLPYAIPERKAYPIGDVAHANFAITRLYIGTVTDADRKKVIAAIKKRYPKNAKLAERIKTLKAKKMTKKKTAKKKTAKKKTAKKKTAKKKTAKKKTTKKGSRRKSQPKGARLAYDDLTKRKKKRKKAKKKPVKKDIFSLLTSELSD